jgi:hypothetical protein
VSLELNPEVERQVLERARAAGTTASDYIAQLLQAYTTIASPNPIARVHGLLNQWQFQDRSPTSAPAPNDGTFTASEALFRQWEREDANLTDEERQAEEKRWQQFQRDINSDRVASGMRPIF